MRTRAEKGIIVSQGRIAKVAAHRSFLLNTWIEVYGVGYYETPMTKPQTEKPTQHYRTRKCTQFFKLP